ncbi:tetratricopeptide repeat protein [Nubsella zeaxanthinifaciens]|uniref:tetratricopeptide repeat protein n=1 Tax=Nubsella zeaxanthinifaciens TaxID=392412 RepID=UPI003CFF7F5A
MALKDGTYLFEDREGYVPYGHSYYTEDFEKALKQLDSLYRKTNDLDYLSDKGLVLILLKRYNEAVQLYLEIEKLQSDRYSTASNIGTAYELLGDNQQALNWIKKAIKINPNSHEGSEWIHVKILEAKIKGKAFITTQFLLNTDFGIAAKPQSNLTKPELQKLLRALYYQLNERVSFVKPKEKIIALLLFDLGNTAFLLGNYDDAIQDYKLSIQYGFNKQLIAKRLEEAKKLSMPPEQLNKVVIQKKETNYYPFWIIGITLTLIVTIFFIYKRKN